MPTAAFWCYTDSEKPPAGKRLLSPDLHISRTYCLGATVEHRTPSRFGVRVTNYIFSDEQRGADLTSNLYQECTETTESWRRGFFGPGEANWNTCPMSLDRNEETVLTRRQRAQEHLIPHATQIRRRAPLTEAELAAKKQQFIDRRIARKNAQTRSSSSESDTDSSSTTEMSDNDNED